MLKQDKHLKSASFAGYMSNKRLQKILICVVSILLAFIIIESGAAPKKYKLNVGDKSPFDITAPRDIINKDKVEEKAKAAEDEVRPIVRQDDTALYEMFMSIDNFITTAFSIRNGIQKKLDEQGIYRGSPDYPARYAEEQGKAVDALKALAQVNNIVINDEQIKYLMFTASDSEILSFKNNLIDIINKIAKEEISKDNLSEKASVAAEEVRNLNYNENLENIGAALIKAVLRPIKTIDNDLTEAKKKEAYKEAYEEALKTEKILKGERIISFGEIVTQDKINMLKELDLLDTGHRQDFSFIAGIFLLVCLLAFVLILYMHHFCRDLIENRQNIIFISLIILIILAVARLMINYASPLAIPVFIATMLAAVMFNFRAAVIINLVLSVAISLMMKNPLQFLYMSLISGTISAFPASKVNQRSKLSMVGFILGAFNVLIIFCLGMITKNDLNEILKDCVIALANGVISVILTIGMLPFWEMAFNMITPFKLLELANPNHPLMKRLLMEAPGTYHHSLMVGNLAEVAVESIGGDSLLARVGAYYHDVGKLVRPFFFKENQLTNNPHDKMTANLSTLVITSHVRDGVELAEKYKIPEVIKDIIRQHHGTTLVAYFYHKAIKNDKVEQIDPDNFRYDGPKPSTKEAAIVMLADSVEAAVRSMPEKTKGKIEGLIRKIIKEKLDDGQLDLCDLTLKDLDKTANAFLTVLSGMFHEREEYPQISASQKYEEENFEAEECSIKEKTCETEMEDVT